MIRFHSRLRTSDLEAVHYSDFLESSHPRFLEYSSCFLPIAPQALPIAY